jgi:hypothetical protein
MNQWHEWLGCPVWNNDRLYRTDEGTGQPIASPSAMGVSPVRRAMFRESPKNSTLSSMRRLFLRSGIRGLMFGAPSSLSLSSPLPSLSSSSRITVRFGTAPRPAASRATRLPRRSRPVLRVREPERPARVGELIATRDPSGCKRRVEKSWTVLRRDMIEPSQQSTALLGPLHNTTFP